MSLRLLQCTVLCGLSRSQPVCNLLAPSQPATCGLQDTDGTRGLWGSALIYDKMLSGISDTYRPYGDEASISITSEQAMKLQLPEGGFPSTYFDAARPTDLGVGFANSVEGEWFALAKEASTAITGPGAAWSLQGLSVYRPGDQELRLRLHYRNNSAATVLHTDVVFNIAPTGDDSCAGLLKWMCAFMPEDSCDSLIVTTTTPAPQADMSIEVSGTKTRLGSGKCRTSAATRRVVLQERNVTHDMCAIRCTMKNNAGIVGGSHDHCCGFAFNEEAGGCILYLPEIGGGHLELTASEDRPGWECWSVHVTGEQYIGETPERAPVEASSELILRLDCGISGALAVRHRVEPRASSCHAPFYLVVVESRRYTGYNWTRRLAAQEVLEGRIPFAGEALEIGIGPTHFSNLLSRLPVISGGAQNLDTLVTSDRLCLDLRSGGACLMAPPVEPIWLLVFRYVGLLLLGILLGFMYARYSSSGKKIRPMQFQPNSAYKYEQAPRYNY